MNVRLCICALAFAIAGCQQSDYPREILFPIDGATFTEASADLRFVHSVVVDNGGNSYLSDRRGRFIGAMLSSQDASKPDLDDLRPSELSLTAAFCASSKGKGVFYDDDTDSLLLCDLPLRKVTQRIVVGRFKEPCLAMCDVTNQICVYSEKRVALVGNLAENEPTVRELPISLVDSDSGYPNILAFCNDGRLLVAGRDNGHDMRCYDTERGNLIVARNILNTLEARALVFFASP